MGSSTLSEMLPGVAGFYVTGGQQRRMAHFASEWNLFDKGVLLYLDASSGRPTEFAQYNTPPELSADSKNPKTVFKAGSLLGNRLFVCSQTEVIEYEVPGCRIVQSFSLPLFNDLHHVQAFDDDRLLIAVTGLDLVIETDYCGNIRSEWSALDEDIWERFSRHVDYRKVSTTKPHLSHPNYVFELHGEVWATRFEQMDAICLDDREKRVAIDVERPHDGIVSDGRIYFTTVDGQVVVADNRDLDQVEYFDLNEFVESEYALGWCRGISILNEDYVLVGFTRLRPSRFRENLRWLRHRFGSRPNVGDQPTRVALYDLRNRKLCWECNMEEYGLSAIFSIIPALDD